MSWGNKPTDGGHLILSEVERSELLTSHPEAARFIRRYMSGGNFIDDAVRYCLWLGNARPNELDAIPEIKERLEKVKAFRLASRAPSTRAYARYPARFRQIAQPNTDYLAVPEVSSERRKYIPMAVLSSEINLQQQNPIYSLGKQLDFRRTDLRNAHGVDKGRLRTDEVRHQLFEHSRL
jgi:hypothetical protein